LSVSAAARCRGSGISPTTSTITSHEHGCFLALGHSEAHRIIGAKSCRKFSPYVDRRPTR
jgi:hypothetical protein